MYLCFRCFPRVSVLGFSFLPEVRCARPEGRLKNFTVLLRFSIAGRHSVESATIVDVGTSASGDLSSYLVSPSRGGRLIPILTLCNTGTTKGDGILRTLLLVHRVIYKQCTGLLGNRFLPRRPFTFASRPARPADFRTVCFCNNVGCTCKFSFSGSGILARCLCR